MIGQTNANPSKDGDNMLFGDPTVNWANLGQANYMIITDENETSNEVGVGEAGLMILVAIEGAGYVETAEVGTSLVAE